MPHSKEENKILDSLKSKGLLYKEDKDVLAEKLLEKEIKDGKKKDEIVNRIINNMKQFGLIFLPTVLIFFRIF